MERYTKQAMRSVKIGLKRSTPYTKNEVIFRVGQPTILSDI